jgi:hypothetical protein
MHVCSGTKFTLTVGAQIFWQKSRTQELFFARRNSEQSQAMMMMMTAIVNHHNTPLHQ